MEKHLSPVTPKPANFVYSIYSIILILCARNCTMGEMTVRQFVANNNSDSKILDYIHFSNIKIVQQKMQINLN